MSWGRFFHRTRADLDHAREFEAHLALETDDNVARGLSPNDAHRAAIRKLGNTTRVREDVYHMNTIGFVETLMQDLRYTVRMLRKSPGFTVTAILTIALGLGANAAIFSFLDAVLLKPLPYPQPERLIAVSENVPQGDHAAVTPGNFLDWREGSKTARLCASTGNWLTMTGHGEPQRVQARLVSYDYFDVLGTPVATGRTFLAEEGVPGSDRVMIVSYRYWQQHLGGDPDILGKRFTLDGAPYKVVGILPAGSWYDRHPADVWLPLALTHANASREFHSMQVFGRLNSGATVAGASAELNGIAARLAAEYPKTNKGCSVTVDLTADRIVGDRLRMWLHLLFAAVGAVLLIACVNLANLLLARSAARERELWVRLSLGAGRMRLVRQFLTESLVLSLAGGVLGCGLAYALKQALMAALPPFTLPPQAVVEIDLPVLAYLFAVSILSGVLFGLAPALAAWRHDVASGLNQGSRGSSGGVSGQRMRAALIVAEVALSFMLVATAGLLIHSFMRMTGVDTGVNTANVLTMQLPRAMQRDVDPVREAVVMDQIHDSVAALPGVIDAAVTSDMPMQGWGFGMPFIVQGRSSNPTALKQVCGFKIVGSSYFHALGMTLMSGRALAPTDTAGTPPVAVMNQTMAKQVFPGESPIGQRVLIQRIVTGKRELGASIPWEIVGVVANEKTSSLDDPTERPGVYVTFDQSPIVGVGLAVRVHGDPSHFTKSINAAIWSVNRDQAITDVKLLEQIKSESTAGSRFIMLVLAGFAGLALLLAAIGIYGVVAYSVTQRTREMGIRSALGASKVQLLVLALRNSVLLTGIGLAAGALGILASRTLVASLLFDTQPAEPATLLAVAAVLTTVALLASTVPARRAAAIDPSRALREE
jgi:putative ABC transport system permease protein